jgi:hypothetical protein
MKRVVVFTEGQTELLFIRELLIRTINNNDLSFECLELKANRQIPFPYKLNPPTAKIHFLLINVGNDESVISEIKSRGGGYTNKGTEIIGLRDMYSGIYRKHSKQIDPHVIDMMRQSHGNIIEQMINKDLIHFYFAIMEVEAWFLAMYNIFERMDPLLTPQYIRLQLNMDLEHNDPENTYFHPASNLSQILQLAGGSYDKHLGEVLGILSHVIPTVIENLIEIGFCNSFVQFYKEIQREFFET